MTVTQARRLHTFLNTKAGRQAARRLSRELQGEGLAVVMRYYAIAGGRARPPDGGYGRGRIAVEALQR